MKISGFHGTVHVSNLVQSTGGGTNNSDGPPYISDKGKPETEMKCY